MQRIVDRGIQVLIPPDTSRRRATRRNWDGGRYDEMRRVLATERGGSLYRKRPTDDRAGVRPDELQPRPGPFPTPRPNRSSRRVAADHRHHSLLKLHRHTLAAA
jgi:hypothetical protein